MASNLAWFDARDLARAGGAIRRAGWNYWLIRGPALWYLVTYDSGGNPVATVPLTTDFTAAEFMAGDWTDELFDSTIAAPTGAILPKLTTGSRTFGSSDNAPGANSLFQLSGTVADENPRPAFTHTPPTDQTPVVSADVVRYDLINSPTIVFVRLAIMGGPPGTGTFSVQLDTETPVTGVAWPGFDQVIEFPDVVVAPGSVLNVTASYTNDVSTYTADSSAEVVNDPFVSLVAGEPMPSLIP